ncbi:MAG: hypothetical protein GY696_22940, partial [Gammaproteobacteria bacterium]|nr:hypothetical protein [Gammaproteobacteria bacterium]
NGGTAQHRLETEFRKAVGRFKQDELPFNLWTRTFRRCATQYGQDCEAQIGNLGSLLTGKAALYYNDCLDDGETDIEVILQRIRKCLKPEKVSEEHIQDLVKEPQREDESVNAYALRLRSKLRDAFPDEKEYSEYAEIIGLKMFKGGLRAKIRNQVRIQKDLNTLKATIDHAVFIEGAWGLAPSTEEKKLRFAKPEAAKKTGGILRSGRFAPRQWQNNAIESGDESDKSEVLSIAEESASETTAKKKSATIDKLADKLGAIERKTAAELDKMKERMLGQNKKFEGITHSTNLRLDGITGESTESKTKSGLRSPTGKSKDLTEGTCFLCHESGHVMRSCPTRRPGDTKDRSFMRNLRQSLVQMELSDDEDDASRLGETDEDVMQLEIIEQGYQTQRAIEAEMFPKPKFGYESFHADPVSGKSHLSNLNNVFLDSDISADESELEEEPRLIQPSKVKPFKKSKHLVTKQNAEMVLHAET